MNSLMPITSNSCPKCQSATADEVVYGDTVDFRGMEFDVENLHESKCRNCGYAWITNAQRTHNGSVIRETYGVIRDELRAKNGLLAGHEIAQTRELFGLSQREAASLFGGGYNAFNKYESGEVLQSFAMDRLLRLTVAVGKPAIDFLRDVFSTPSFVVISTSRTTQEFRIAMLLGSSSSYVTHKILGTNEKIVKFIPDIFGTGSQNLESLPPAYKHLVIQNHKYEN